MHPAEAASAVTQGGGEQARRRDRSLRGPFVAVNLAVASLVLLAFAFPVWVCGPSMEPVIADGSLVLVDRSAPSIEGLHRGDIVVFAAPPSVRAAYPSLTKRVIGLPGDEITIDRGGVSVNGRRLAEPYLALTTSTSTSFGDRRVSWRVPPGQVFVLGDHRGDSIDSRVFGTIEVAAIAGRAWLILRFGPDGA